MERVTAYVDGFNLYHGIHDRRAIVCHACDSTRRVFEEKESDVNLAVAMVHDAALRRFDTALLISADADLGPAVRAIRDLAPAARVVVAFPPARHSVALQSLADGYVNVGEDKIRQAQLPDEVTVTGGLAVRRPAYWTETNQNRSAGV